MKALQLDDIVGPHPDVVGQLVGEEAVLVLPGRGKVQVLSPVAARIWQLVDGAHSARQIAAQICAEYEVESGVAEADTLEFLGQLLERGVVQFQS